MSPSDFLEAVYVLTFVCVLLWIFRLRKFPRVYITDYARGLRFKKGAFRNVLGPGSYRPVTRKVHVEIVDLRPVPFILNGIGYRDALQNESFVSIGGEMLVGDPYLAATSAKNRVSDSLPIIRDAVRSAASRAIVDANDEYRARMAEGLTSAVNDRLRGVGMRVTNIEITEIFSRQSKREHIPAGLN